MQDLLAAHTGARAITLDLDLSERLPVSRFSKPHLEHILWNLVANAVDAMTGRGGRIRISTRTADAGDAVLVVSDDGPGIAPEHLEKVQEPFLSTKSHGSGLGLSICRSIAWQYGGGLEIESALGHGTEVRVRLLTGGQPAYRGGSRGLAR